MSEFRLLYPDEDYADSVSDGDSSMTDVLEVYSTATDIVDLMDISRNKRWICYVHYSQDDQDDQEIKNVQITRKRLKAFNHLENEEEVIAFNQSYDAWEVMMDVSAELNEEDMLFDLNNHYSLIKNHSRFLSISPYGNYIALSCHEENGEGKKNPSCIIFEVMNNSVSYYTEIKDCNGRVVIVDQNQYCLRLAVISSDKLVIYSQFSKFEVSPDHFYDLTPFGSSPKNPDKIIAYQKPFIENASWAKINDTETAKHLMTLSRHIRYDVLVTPFVDEGIVRLWSIKDDGVRLTSFSAPNEHLVALSKDLKYAATVRDGIRAVKIYNIKTGLLVYTLQSRFIDEKSLLEVTHVRFCYESRYLALSGLQATYDEEYEHVKTEVVFEVWYIEAEKSIYGKILDSGKKCDSKTKTVQPFILRDIKMRSKCLKGLYTYTNQQNENKIYCLELIIDEEFKSNSQITIEWLNYDPNGDKIIPSNNNDHEIENDITDNKNLKCANIYVDNKRFYVRFGNRTIQLWRLGDPSASNSQDKDDQLVYIRAHRCPNYGISYSFQDTWVIEDFNSIYFTESTPAGRMILNIKKDEDTMTEQERSEMFGLYHTQEIFLPLTNDDEGTKKFQYHTFESACQALYYLNWCWEQKRYKSDISNSEEVKCETEEEETEFNVTILLCRSKMEMSQKSTEYYKNKKYKENLLNLFGKTKDIIIEAVTESNYDKSNYFATMAGSRTLAMLASFHQGRDIIKRLLQKDSSTSFSIFSYKRHIPYYGALVGDENHNKDNKATIKKVVFGNVLYGQERTKNWKMYYRNSPKTVDMIIGQNVSIAENENVLTVLIAKKNYDLYSLMFNRILSDSKKIGPGCLSALVDALLFLQDEGHTDLLLSSSQKLSYLAIDINILGVLTSEKGEIIKVNEYDSKIRNLECHSTMEQLRKYDMSMLNIYDKLYYKLKKRYTYAPSQKSPLSRVKGIWNTCVKNPLRIIFDASSKSDPEDRTKLCVIPLPYFNTYNNLLEDRPKTFSEKQLKYCLGDYPKSKGKSDSEAKDLLQHFFPEYILKGSIKTIDNIVYKQTSSFVAIASNQSSNNLFRQGDTVLEVMLQYKWTKFLQSRFIGVCIIHTVYYVSYCTGVLFALELHDYKSGVDDLSFNREHLVSIVCMFVSGSLLLFQEIRQIITSRKWMDYLFSGYNWVDFAAFTFPPFTLLQLIYNWNYFYEACSITTLILWLHAIVRLRVISFVGITLETIIQLSRKVWSILFIFLLVIFAFTHSFIVLLRQHEDTYFQETYHGVTSMYSSDTPMNGQIPITVVNTTLHDISSDNGFADPFKAFYQVWLVIFGVWDPLVNGEAGDDKMVFILCMLFALITVLIFTNMVIALMSSTVDEVKNKGNTVWVSHFASVVAEMEQLWCLPSTRRNRNNNPMYIYYTANHSVVKKQEEKLERETKELKKQVLNIDS